MKNVFDEETWLSGRSLTEFPEEYVVIDLETTGLSPSNCEIIEVSGIKIANDDIVDKFSSLIKPNAKLPEFIQELTGITDDMLLNAPQAKDVIYDFMKFIDHNIIVGHNVNFDINFLRYNCQNLLGCNFDNDYVDTLRISKKFIQDVKNYKLSTLSEYFNINPENSHRALDDCYTTYYLYKKLYDLNATAQSDFIAQFPDSDILANKLVVFKGHTIYGDLNAYKQICKKAGGKATDIFFSSAHFIVFGKNTYNKFLRGDYSEKMTKALQLSQTNNLTILSEEEFISMFGVSLPHPQRKTRNYTSKKIDIKDLKPATDDFDVTNPLYDKTCVFTGSLDKMSRKEAMQHVVDLGGHVSNGVTRNTNYLILGCNDYCTSIKDGKSIKHKKAEEYKLKGFDIDIIDEDLFYSMIEED